MTSQSKRNQSSLPKYVSRDPRYGVVYRPYLGRIDGQIKWGKRVKLASHGASDSDIWKAYAELKGTEARPYTISWLFFKYFASNKFKKKAPRTQQDYRNYAKAIANRDVGGKLFGSLPLASVKRVSIRTYLDTASAPVQANRQITFLSTAWNWLAEFDEALPPNPAHRISKNEETPRDLYISDDVYLKALSLAPDWLGIAMELAYWCRARRGEVLAFTYDDYQDGGLYVQRTKKSQSEITVSRRVTELIEQSRHLPCSEGCNHVVRNANGEPVSGHGFNSAWRRLASKMGGDHFHYHDLKAKGVSDMEGEQWAGHRSKKALAVYQRKARRISPDYGSVVTSR